MGIFRYGEKHSTERGPLQRVNVVVVKCGIVSFIGWVISYAHELEDFSSYFGNGVEISWS